MAIYQRQKVDLIIQQRGVKQKLTSVLDASLGPKIAQIPGVVSVCLTSAVTMDGSNSSDPVIVEEFPQTASRIPPMRRYKWVSPGYFHTMGNPILAGRDLTWADTYQKAPFVVVSENLARLYWKQPAAALGKRIRSSPNSAWREIVGVAGNERDDGAGEKPPTTVFWPMLIKDQFGEPLFARRSQAFAVRSARTGAPDFLKDVRAAVWSVNPNLPLASVRTLAEIQRGSMARTSFTLTMLGIAAIAALLLGVVGIYGVVSYSVSQRTREIGIRMALGAGQDQVRGLFVRDGLILTGLGVAAGMAAAIALTRLMAALLYEVSPLDPATYAVVALGLAAAALLASYLPARRATRIDPIEALRFE